MYVRILITTQTTYGFALILILLAVVIVQNGQHSLQLHFKTLSPVLCLFENKANWAAGLQNQAGGSFHISNIITQLYNPPILQFLLCRVSGLPKQYCTTMSTCKWLRVTAVIFPRFLVDTCIAIAYSYSSLQSTLKLLIL